MMGKREATEGAMEMLNDIPSYWTLWCDACGWTAERWTDGEVQVLQKVHQETCPSDGGPKLTLQRTARVNQSPEELGFGGSDE